MRCILLSLLAGSISLSTQSSIATEVPHGNVIELHSCELYAGGCKVSSESTQAGRYMLRLWDFAGGQFNETGFQGLKVALLQTSTDNLAAADSKSDEAVVYLPDGASKRQQNALLAWLKCSQPDFQPEKIHIRTESITVQKTETGYAVSAGNYITLQTKPLESCDTSSCGEELWYEPRTATTLFTVAMNHSSTVAEPLLKLTWKDSAQRSVFLGRFGNAGPAPRKDVFVTMNDFCGATGLF